MNDSSQDQFLSSAEAAKVLGVHAASLKRWSDQGRINCVRTPGGHRRFLRSDVERFAEKPAAKTPEEAGFTKRLLKVLVAGDQPKAEAVLLDHWGETGRWERVGDDVGVMLAEIGASWLKGGITTAEEHIASETLSARLLDSNDDPIVRVHPSARRDGAWGRAHAGPRLCELVLAERLRPWLGRFSPVEMLLDIIQQPRSKCWRFLRPRTRAHRRHFRASLPVGSSRHRVRDAVGARGSGARPTVPEASGCGPMRTSASSCAACRPKGGKTAVSSHESLATWRCGASGPSTSYTTL